MNHLSFQAFYLIFMLFQYLTCFQFSGGKDSAWFQVWKEREPGLAQKHFKSKFLKQSAPTLVLLAQGMLCGNNNNSSLLVYVLILIYYSRL